jgi:hypothetical protein
MAREQRKRRFVWKNIQKPDEIQSETYAKYLEGLPAELAGTKGGLCHSAKSAEEFLAFVKQNLSSMSPNELVRRAIVCSNLLTRTDKYKQFHERVLKAVCETDRVSILPSSMSPSGQIRLSALAENIKQSDTIIVLCFDQEWDWAFDVLRQFRQVSSPEEPAKTRLLIVGPQYQADKGDVDVSNFSFQTFKELEVDENTFKKQLKSKIDPALVGGAPLIIDVMAAAAGVNAASQQLVQSGVQ